MLRGIDPELTRKALTEIIRKLKARGIEVLLCGMLAAPNFGEDYAKAFNRIYPEIAKAEGVLFDPFFLEGVAADPKLNLRDGIHPSAAGVTAIAGRILPKAEELLARVRAKRGS
jgi:acyl-CoA thioesterase-1